MTTTASSLRKPHGKPGPTSPALPALELPPEQIAAFARDGFTAVRGVFAADEVERFRAAAAAVYDHGPALNPDDAMFKQVIQVWRDDPVLRELTLDPTLAGLATQLAGVPLRLWHDQLLMKRPHNGSPTEYHQDAPYWPHAQCRQCLSAWVALVDVPVERGCMTFIGGQQDRRDLRATDIADSADLFDVAPDLVYAERVTVPLRAGDVTFHHGYTPHTANANDTDEFRFAHVVIYIDRDTHYDGRPHPCTDGLDVGVGSTLPDEHFPPMPA